MTATCGRWMDVKELQRLVLLQAKIDRLRVEASETAMSFPGDVNVIEAAIQGALGAVRAARQAAIQATQQSAQPILQTMSAGATVQGGGGAPGVQVICPIGTIPDGQGGCTTG